MYETTAVDWFCIRGRGEVTILNKERLPPDFHVTPGDDILINGLIYTVLGIDSGSRKPTSNFWGLLVKRKIPIC